MLNTFQREILLTIHVVKEVVDVDKLAEGQISPILIPIPIMVEENFWWKMTFGGRQTLVEDDLWWKTTFGGRRPLVEDDIR